MWRRIFKRSYKKDIKVRTWKQLLFGSLWDKALHPKIWGKLNFEPIDEEQETNVAFKNTSFTDSGPSDWYNNHNTQQPETTNNR